MLLCTIIHSVLQDKDKDKSIKVISSVLHQLLHKCLIFSEHSGPSVLITKCAQYAKQIEQRGKELQQSKMIAMLLGSFGGLFVLLI